MMYLQFVRALTCNTHVFCTSSVRNYDDNHKILLHFMSFPCFDKERSSIMLFNEDPKKQVR